MARREHFSFTGAKESPVAGVLDLPDGAPRGHALFAHCFTCSKDTIASTRIARALVDAGIAVARIDFTGLGESGGDFRDTTFSSDLEDLVLAAEYLHGKGAAPQLLVGHSMGGAAVIDAARYLPGVQAVATVAAPYNVSAVTRHFAGQREAIDRDGVADVMLAGRPLPITREYIADIRWHDTAQCAAELDLPLLLLHAPDDDEVSFADATRLSNVGGGPKSLIALDGADHLLTRTGAATRAGRLIAAWAEDYLAGAADETAEPLEEGLVVVETNGVGTFGQTVRAGRHTWQADEPDNVPGALDSGPSPYDHLLAALGTCTSMTLRMYADRKKIPLGAVSVRLRHSRVHATDCAEAETEEGYIALIEREITMTGDLDDATRKRLLKIADRCPVHRTLESEIIVRTVER